MVLPNLFLPEPVISKPFSEQESRSSFTSPLASPFVESPVFHEDQIHLSSPFHLTSSDGEQTDSGTSKNAHTSPSATTEESHSRSCDLEDISLPDPFDNTADPFLHADFSSNDSGEKLFPGCSITVLQALAILFSWFTSFGGVSKAAFGELLHLLHLFILPSGNCLPSSYAAALAKIRPFLLPVTDYHCCINDCIIYREEYKCMTQCPKCGEPRYFDGTEAPRKRFKYIPLTPRFQCYYGNTNMSQLLQSHNSDLQQVREVQDLHQSKAWYEWYGKGGQFHENPRSLSLGLCTDGLNPFSHNKVAYSMWPITLSLLNLPRNIRQLFGAMMLVGIIPGKSEPANSDPYLQVVVDELLQLFDFTLYDAYRNEHFRLKVDILLHVFDYPGQCKIFHNHGMLCKDTPHAD